MKLSTFVADITPPVGEALCDGLCPPVSSIEHPLLAKGIILREKGESRVLCALDWAGVCNDAHALFRRKIAEAAGASPDGVAVQALHQHTAPAVDSNAVRLMARTAVPVPMSGLGFLERAADSVAGAVRKAAGGGRKVTHVGTGRAPVKQVASARRIRQADGKVLTRFSNPKDPALRLMPEGVIDGFLQTVSFCEGDRALAQLHYYAMHPQSFYFDGRVTYDLPGLARERLERESGVFQVYFTGCGGNITVGKYNDGTPAARSALAGRLYDGMAASVASLEPAPAGLVEWQSVPLDLPLRSGADFSEGTNRRILHDTKAGAEERLKAAMILSMIERARAGRRFELSCLAIGDLRILHLPGEPFVEYQLWAQQCAPERFVAVAGYGDCGMWYICTDQTYADAGGYEQTWSFIDPSEEYLKRTIAAALT